MSTQTTGTEGVAERQRAAFGDTHNEAFYYAYPLLNQRLDLLQHLTQFSDRILVIRGEPGSGKTTLLEHLLKRLSNETRLCRLNADQGLSSEVLLNTLGTALGLRTSASIEMIRERLSDMQHSTGVCHLLIDDAHQLPATTLTTLMSLFYSKGGSALHIALFAEPGIVALFNGTGIASHLGERLQTMGMPALEEEDCTGYLRHRLQAAGLEGPAPFTEQQVRDIHDRSNGLPGRVNTEAVCLLSRQDNKSAPAIGRPTSATSPTRPADTNTPVPATQPAEKRVRPGLRRELKWVLGGVFATLIATLLIMQEEINQAFEGQATVAPPPQAPAATALKTPRLNDVLVPTRQPAQVPTTLDHPLKPNGKSPRGTLAAVTTAATTAVTTTATTAEPVIPEPAAAPQTEAHAAKPVAAVENGNQKPVRPKPATTPDGGLKDADWLLAQTPQSYTLQLLGSINERVIRDFARRHTIAEQSAYYRGLRKGKSWYSLLYGLYPGKKAALAARAELPPVLQKQSPWIRSLASVQADIRKSTRR